MVRLFALLMDTRFGACIIKHKFIDLERVGGRIGISFICQGDIGLKYGMC